jgi:hypothetical protein
MILGFRDGAVIALHHADLYVCFLFARNMKWKMATKFWTDRFWGLGIDRRIILKWILKK